MQFRRVVAYVLCINFICPAPTVADGCTESWDKNYFTHIGKITEGILEKLPIDGRLHSLQPSLEELRHFRLRIKADGPMPPDWRLTFYDANAQHPLQIMGPADFSRSATVWSRRFDGSSGQAGLDLKGEHKSQFLTINGAIVVSNDATITYYSVQNQSELDWQCLSCPQHKIQKALCDKQPVGCVNSSITMRRRGEGVGMLMVFGAKEAWTCSGFLIAPSLFLTNWHCGGVRAQNADSYWDNDSLRNLVIDFSWDGDSVSNEYGWSGDPVIDGHNVLMDRDLDYAIFRISPLQQSIGLPPVLRIGMSNIPQDGKPIHIIHHPLSRVKHLTLLNCRILLADYPSWFDNKPGVDFLHSCDTEGGSSGAPIFNVAGQVIGVHHYGHTLDASGKCDRRNKGVKLTHIIQNLPEKIREAILHAQH